MKFFICILKMILVFCFTFCNLSLFGKNTEDYDQVSKKLTIIEAPHIRFYVPLNTEDKLTPLIKRLDNVYSFLCEEAHFTPSKKLIVHMSDEEDLLNGWSSSIPRPFVTINMPSGTTGSYFAGSDRRIEFIAIHEFTHILNMEPSSGFRKIMENIFGRVLPNDILSILMFYFTTPSQVTMPTFWLEGLAEWAETHYSSPNSIWGGRGRDSLTHMIWRQDAENGSLPDKSNWRYSSIHWPYGARPYHYGIAFTRYLEAKYSDQFSIWELALNQSKRWPFIFKRGAGNLTGLNHHILIDEAMKCLEKEQKNNIHILKSVPITEFSRLTPKDYIFGPPAWTADGYLLSASYRPYASKKRFVYVDSKGKLKTSRLKSFDISPVRRSPNGTLITSTIKKTAKERYRSRISIITPKGKLYHLGLRLIHPDFAKNAIQGTNGVAAIKLTDAGRQELRLYKLIKKKLYLYETVQVTGIPWNPAFRPNPSFFSNEILWVETFENESKLILASIDDLNQRKVIALVKGKILHPCWNINGNELYFCSDISGVFNAYRINFFPDDSFSNHEPVTHTLGGVTACVPGPEDDKLAILDHDVNGPFLSIINKPENSISNLPEIPLSWPAPLLKNKNLNRKDLFIRPPDSPFETELTEKRYTGMSNMEFLFWTPTTLVTDGGGTGIQAFFSDPMNHHEIIFGTGIGDVESEPVGQFSYFYNRLSRFSLILNAYALELTSFDRIETVNGNFFNYSETSNGGSAFLTFDFSGIEKLLMIAIGYGYFDSSPINSSIKEYENEELVNLKPFEGIDQFAEFGLFYNDTTLYPTSYYQEDGFLFSINHRISGNGMGGDLNRKRTIGEAGYILSINHKAGHQLETRIRAGQSKGDLYLQGAFTIGGSIVASYAIPRGYPETEETGHYLNAFKLAYRFPFLRSFKGLGTTPFETRQFVLELFYEGGKISTDKISGNGEWYRSAGLELTYDMRFWNIPLRFGFWAAKQMDGDEDMEYSFVLRSLFD